MAEQSGELDTKPQPNNPLALDRWKVIGGSVRLSAAGEAERYAAQAIGWGSSRKIICWHWLWLAEPHNRIIVE